MQIKHNRYQKHFTIFGQRIVLNRVSTTYILGDITSRSLFGKVWNQLLSSLPVAHAV